jgi:hypothetical protein
MENTINSISTLDELNQYALTLGMEYDYLVDQRRLDILFSFNTGDGTCDDGTGVIPENDVSHNSDDVATHTISDRYVYCRVKI